MSKCAKEKLLKKVDKAIERALEEGAYEAASSLIYARDNLTEEK
jgi:hypothetical protein